MSSRSCNYVSLDVTQGVQIVMPVEVHVFLLDSMHNRAWFPRWSTGSLYRYSLASSIAWSDHDSFDLNFCFFMVKENKQDQPFPHNSLCCITCLPVTTTTTTTHLCPITITFFRGSKVAKNNQKTYNKM